MGVSSVEQDIAGDYQLTALLKGWRFQRAWHRARLDLVARMLPPTCESLALDAAAGSGIVSWRFRDARIICADNRMSACRSLRVHSPDARAAVADLGALPFRSGTFSRVYLLEAIEHLTEEHGWRALTELRRVSRPGAQFLVTTPNYRSYWLVLERALDALRLTPPMTGAQHVTRYDRRSLGRAMHATGWRVAHLGSFNFFAPFLGTLSAPAGRWAVDREVVLRHTAGALLYAVCEAV